MSHIRPSLLFAALVYSATAQTGFAAPGDVIESSCSTQLGLPAAACQCLRQISEAELSGKQLDMMVAVVTQDDAAQNRLQAEMTPEELTATATFMQSAPGRCGG